MQPQEDWGLGFGGFALILGIFLAFLGFCYRYRFIEGLNWESPLPKYAMVYIGLYCNCSWKSMKSHMQKLSQWWCCLHWPDHHWQMEVSRQHVENWLTSPSQRSSGRLFHVNGQTKNKTSGLAIVVHAWHHTSNHMILCLLYTSQKHC